MDYGDFFEVGRARVFRLTFCQYDCRYKAGAVKNVSINTASVFLSLRRDLLVKLRGWGEGQREHTGGEGKVYHIFCSSHHPIALIIFVAFVRTHPNLVFL